MFRTLIVQVFVSLVISPLYAGVQRHVETVVVSTPGPAAAHPYRDRLKGLCKPVCYLAVSAIAPRITNELLSADFLADLAGGALMLAVASLGIFSSGLDRARRLSGAT